MREEVQLYLFGSRFCRDVTLCVAFASHHIEHMDGAALAAVEDPAWRFNDLAIASRSLRAGSVQITSAIAPCASWLWRS